MCKYSIYSGLLGKKYWPGHTNPNDDSAKLYIERNLTTKAAGLEYVSIPRFEKSIDPREGLCVWWISIRTCVGLRGTGGMGV